VRFWGWRVGWWEVVDHAVGRYLLIEALCNERSATKWLFLDLDAMLVAHVGRSLSRKRFEIDADDSDCVCHLAIHCPDTPRCVPPTQAKKTGLV